MRRPNPAQWLWYSFGGGLPAELNEWVLHDTTGRTWWARQVLRSILYVLPLIVVLLLFVPGPLWVRAMSALGGLIMALIFSLGYMVETTEHRLVKAGYPVGTGEAVRTSRSDERSHEATARRRERMFERIDRRMK